MDEKLKQLNASIFEHLQLRRSMLQQIQDVFSPLGEDAPYFRAIFDGVEAPIKDKEELIKKAGGSNRLITVSDPRYGELTFALLDVLDAVIDLEVYLPIKSLDAFVEDVISRREKAKSERGRFSFSGWGRVPTKHLQRILEELKAPQPTRAPLLRTRPRLFPAVPCTNATMLSDFAEEFKRRAEQAKGRGGNPGSTAGELTVSDLYAVLAEFFAYWSGTIVMSCESEAQARLVEATNARQEAEAQANTAKNMRNQALAATTATALCNFASQSRTAAIAADAAADNSEDAAVLARTAANSCPGSAKAANAATQAEQQATQARAAANNADIAADESEARCTECNSIPVATIEVHVQDDDKYEDDVNGANVTVRNLTHNACPGVIVGCVTGSNGRCSVTGPFRDSQVLVIVNYGSYNMSRQFYMATDTRSEYFKIPGLDV